MFDPEVFDRQGFAIIPDVVRSEELDALTSAVEAIRPGGAALDRGGHVYASRNLLREVRAVRDLAGSVGVRALAAAVLGAGAFVVRGLLFDKSPAANWMVPWHQDLTIAVRGKVKSPGFGPWTVKAGVPHVRPPIGILEKMVTVRVAIDADEPARGPLRVLPGSHRSGRLDAASTHRWLELAPAVTCLVPRGGALVMRPLLLHSSRASDELAEHSRRVVHLEFAAEPLPGGLEWDESPAVDLGMTSP